MKIKQCLSWQVIINQGSSLAIVRHAVSVGDCVKILLLIFTIETLMSDSSDCNVGFFDGQDCVGNKQINVPPQETCGRNVSRRHQKTPPQHQRIRREKSGGMMYRVTRSGVSKHQTDLTSTLHWRPGIKVHYTGRGTEAFRWNMIQKSS